MEQAQNQDLEFADQQFGQVQQISQFGGGWDDDDEPPAKKIETEDKMKTFNGRYLKIKKIGEGSFNTVYLVQDLQPEGKRRILSEAHQQMIDKIPSSMANPYKKTGYSYFDDDFDDDGNEKKKDTIDPQILEELRNLDNLLPDNQVFESAYEENKQEELKQEGTKNLIALKKQKNVINMDSLDLAILREIKLLQGLDHPNIVKLNDVFHQKGLLHYSLEYGPIELSDLILKQKTIVFEPQHIKCIMKQILQGVEYLHSKQIMHRDIKPGNMVLNSGGQVKIIDFNSAKQCDGDQADQVHTKQTTTQMYRSPEQLFSSQNYTLQTDIWSLGCIFGELYNRQIILPGQGQIDQLNNIFKLRGTITKESWPDAYQLPDFMEFNEIQPQDLTQVFPTMSPQAIDLIDKMLQLDPSKRPTASQLLAHPYFTEEEPLACEPGELPIQSLL